jgi:hypothetical protein
MLLMLLLVRVVLLRVVLLRLLLEPAPAAAFRLARLNYPERCAPERLYPFA